MTGPGPVLPILDGPPGAVADEDEWAPAPDPEEPR